MTVSDRRSALTLGLIVLLLGLLWWNNHAGLNAKQQQNCQAINNERQAILNYIDQQLDRAEKSLPTIGYYKQHPVELGRQLAAINLQRQDAAKAFAQVSC
jgi:hypothetical protein